MQEQVKVLNQRKLSNVWHLSLVAQIFIGLLVGIMAGVIAQVSPWQAQIGIVGTLLGSMFVGALKAVAPLLVFVLVIAAISQHRQGNPTNIRPILMLYLVGTFAAAISAVAASFLFPSELLLSGAVMRNLLLKLVANPVQALAEANYLGILAWGLVLGAAFRHTGENTRTLIADVAAVVSQVVRWVIRFAPIGIFGLVLTTIVVDGFAGLERFPWNREDEKSRPLGRKAHTKGQHTVDRPGQGKLQFGYLGQGKVSDSGGKGTVSCCLTGRKPPSRGYCRTSGRNLCGYYCLSEKTGHPGCPDSCR
ncbi:MAG: hypothetical protein CSA10_00290 [Cardiobacteriales bacterium]|nr:MAG: hypothetical protein CSA10_00290 [Cardiobacteriales bacterium]